jgi:hypothetical protein
VGRRLRPKPSEQAETESTEGNVNAGYGGDPNNSLNATFNIPLVEGKLAIRATIFQRPPRCYIDNARHDSPGGHGCRRAAVAPGRPRRPAMKNW